MNSAIGTSLQISPIKINQATSTEGAIPSSACLDGSSDSGYNDFFAQLLNDELAALTDADTLSANDGSIALESVESLENAEDFSALDLPVAILQEALEQLNLTENGEVASSDLSAAEQTTLLQEVTNELVLLYQQALEQLPKNVTALPPTAENKQFIHQQAVALMISDNPAITAKLEQVSGMHLPLEGKALPEIVKAQISEGDFAKQSSGTPFQLSKGLSNPTEQALNSAVNKSNLTTEDSMTFDESLLSKQDGSKLANEKMTIDQLISKHMQQSDAGSQKFSADNISQTVNQVSSFHVSGVTQPTLNGVAASPLTATLHLPTNPSTDQWGSALGDKVRWMINTRLESAELRIDPPSLGKMDVKIQMNDDGATIVIQTQHAATRDLVDAASYRLKEMLQESGFQNVDVDVSHKESQHAEQQFDDQETHSDHSLATAEKSEESINSVADGIIAGQLNNGRPGLDIFA
ncbi:MAG: flagellar hook-length control protein FliK [Gammaproteobacteria bacterium]|nr:flagellar hook-length control protein FliK [Gammaproteobacteria bacterium]